MLSPKAVTSPPGWGSSQDRCRPAARTILGRISKRGNRYLRVLFVQAAWVVLIKHNGLAAPRALSPGSRPPRSACTTTSWRSRSPTSSLAYRLERSRWPGIGVRKTNRGSDPASLLADADARPA